MKTKFSKLLSVLIALAIVVSTCFCVVGTAATTGTEAICYVGTATSDAPDGSEGNPYATVNDAIVAANTAGTLAAGDVLIVKVLNNVQWGGVQSSSLMSTTEHTFNLLVTSNTVASPVTVTGSLSNLALGGPTTLDGIILNANSYLALMNHDFVVESDAAVSAGWFMTGRSGSSRTVAKQNVIIDGSLSCNHFRLGNDWNNVTFTDSINVVINDANHGFKIRFGCGNGTAYFANVNLNIKAAKMIEFVADTYDFTNGYLNIINSSGVNVSLDTGELANISNDKKWIVNNANTSYKNALDYTNTTGQFKVNPGYDATATNADSNVTVGTTAVNQMNILDLTTANTGAGLYTANIEKAPVTYNYYVQSGGTGDGTTEGSPVATVAEAVTNAIANGVAAKDTLRVNVLGTTAVEWGTVPTHSFELYVTSSVADAKVNLVDSLSGNTRFGNVELTGTSDSPSYTNGYSIVLEEGTKVSRVNKAATALQGFAHANLSGNAPTYTNDVYTEYRLLQDIKIMHGDYWKGVAYNGNINFVLDNEVATPTVTLGSSRNANAAVNANLNLIIKKAKGFNIVVDACNNFGANSAVQVINSSSRAITETSNGLGNITTNVEGQAVPKWILNNNTGVEDLIEVTNVAGTYVIKTDSKYEITVTKPDGSTAIVQDGTLTLPAGVSTFTAQRMPATFDCYVGTTTSDAPNGSESNPYATVTDAITAINAGGEVKSTDTLNIIALNNISWGATATPLHTYGIVVKSKTNAVALAITSGTNLGGTTTFDNINATVGGVSGALYLYRQDFTLTETASLVSPHFMFGRGNTSGEPEDGQTVIINGSLTSSKSVTFGNDWNNVTYAGPVNLTLNDPSHSFPIRFGSGNGHATYADVNINIKEAESVSFASLKNGDALRYTLNGNLNIINSTAKVIGLDDGGLADIDDSKKWIINNAYKLAVTFTGVTGVYAVPEDVVIHAYKNGEKVAESNKGVLDLSQSGAGVYSLVEYVPPREVEFTIANGEKTVCQVIEQAIAEGLTDRDTAVITLTGDTAVKYGYTTQNHLFKVVIKSEEGTAVDFAPETNVNLVGIVGDTIFDGVVVKRSDTASGFILFNGYDMEMTADTTISGITWLLSGNNTVTTTYTEQSLVFNNVIDGGKNILLGSEWKGLTYSGNVNITVGNSASAPKFAFGSNRESIFNGNINIKLNGANITSIQNNANSTFGGAIQIISKNALKDTVYTAFNALTVAGGVYTVFDKTGEDTAIDFGDSAGKFIVPTEKTYRAVRTSDKTYADFSGGNLDLTTIGAGNYFISVPEVYTGEQTEYADYINYRDSFNGQKALNNLAAKLNNKEDVNVVYYGGSVTQGTGASNADVTSWRARIGAWLEVNFPQSNITNINSAIGGTGTLLGSYRLNHAVIEQQPDLLFIEFSINDYYGHCSDAVTSKQFETIVRNVRQQLPECDIVTVLVTDQHNAPTAQKGELHSQAKVHEAVSAAYGIPTIHVGRALADKLPENFTADDWATYFPIRSNGAPDIVHPNDTGYALYADVISEFLANSLLGNKTVDTVVNHTVPDMINHELLDGDIKLYRMNSAISEYSAANGGSAFDLQIGGIYPHFEGKFHLDETSDVLVMQFEGTELALLDHHTSCFALNVQIDDGEVYQVTLSDILPTVLASGLKRGTHKAKIWPAFEDGKGEWTNIYGLFGRDETVVTAKYSEVDGDANSDNTLDIRDLVFVDGIIDGSYTKYYLVDADINADGKIDATDKNALRTKMLEK